MSWLSKVIDEVENWIKSINWTTVANDFNTAISDLENTVLPVLEELFPGTSSTVADVVTPVLNSAKSAVDAMTSVASQYASGSVSASALTGAAHTVQAAIVAASSVISAAMAGTSTSTTTTATNTSLAGTSAADTTTSTVGAGA